MAISPAASSTRVSVSSVEHDKPVDHSIAPPQADNVAEAPQQAPSDRLNNNAQQQIIAPPTAQAAFMRDTRIDYVSGIESAAGDELDPGYGKVALCSLWQPNKVFFSPLLTFV